MRIKNKFKMMALTVMMALCVNTGILAVPGAAVVTEAAENEETKQDEYSLPDVGADGTYLYDVFMYGILSDGTIEIRGYTGDDAVTQVDIPAAIAGKTVTAIGDRAFYNKRVTHITIPEGVVSIGDSAFKYCSWLSSVVIPRSVTSIDARAFDSCRSLNGVSIPEGVSIGEQAFYGCGFSSITIPRGTVMEKSVFQDCGNLTSVTIQEGVTAIPEGTFDGCGSLKRVVIPGSVTVIGEKAFNRCGLVSINLPEGVTDIGRGAFLENGSLKTIIIPSSVIRIETMAFNGCGNVTKVCNNSAVTIALEYIRRPTKYWMKLGTNEVITEIANGTAVTDDYVDDTEVRNFVNRLYTLVLAREAEEAGLESWTNALVTGESSGVDAGYGFVFSDECKQKNLSNEDFVEILYNTFMNRASDEGGKSSWVSQLNAGVEREKVFEGFIYSPEFAQVCEKSGIKVGNTGDVGALANALSHYRNRNADITKFVARCYTEALGREYEPDGLEAWCKVIIEKSNTPKQVAQNFIFSDEFIQMDLNDEDYVKVLYRTFMGREADEGGLAAWVEVLKSGREDRTKVLEGFSDSAEFYGILQSFGLN